MRNPISKFRSMLQWFRPTRRAQSEQTLGNPSRAKEPAAEALSPQKFREMFAGMLADPETRTAILRSLVTCLPAQGGACAPPSDISSGTFGANCATGNYIFPTGDNVGIGITTPAVALHIFAPTASDSDAKYNLVLGDSTSAAAGVGGGIDFSGYYNGTTSKAGFANIRGVKENGTQGDYASALIFDTRINGGNQTERMRITSKGNVQIGGPTSTTSAWQTLLLGTTASKQSNFGPEMITAAATNSADPQNRRVVLWSGAEAEQMAMFLINSTGMLEWGAGGSNDQDYNLSRSGVNQMLFSKTSLGFSKAGEAQPRILLKYDETGIFLGDGTDLPDFNIFRGGPQTITGATPTSLTGTTITLTDQNAYHIVVRVVGRKSDGSDHAFFYQAALAYRQGGGALIEGSVANVITAIKSSGASGWACTIVASGSNVNVQVTGQAGATINWSATVEYQQVS